MMTSKHAYVHVPFCSSVCKYCAFSRSLNLNKTEAWLNTIEKEIRKAVQNWKTGDPDFVLDSLYFGGGTPSALSTHQLKRLCDLFEPVVNAHTEWSMEANPESLDEQKLEIMKAAGISRISIGVQSLNDEWLKYLGRNHSAAQAKEVIGLCREKGFSNLSCDILYGWKGQDLKALEKDIDAFLELDMPHYSAYSLILEDNSVFGKQHLEEADEDSAADAWEMICDKFQKTGYVHYEISSFCKPGHECLHNMNTWQDGNYAGFGWGAVGRDDRGLYHGPESLEQYLEKGYSRQYEVLTKEDRAFEAIMTGLRTRKGLNVTVWQDKYGMDFWARYSEALKPYESYIKYEDGWLSCSEKGFEILDTLLVALLMAS